jgi:hypothetical protein
MKLRYWVHHESESIFITFDEVISTDGLVEEISKETYEKLKVEGYQE